MPEERGNNFFIELLKFAVIALIIVVPIRVFVAKPFLVSGQSMEPTFDNGQYLIVDELTYHFEPPQRGDVIIFRYPKDPSQYYIKRVIGLPGETVQILNGDIYITDTSGTKAKLDEPYVVYQGNGANMTVTLPPGEYFAMGDNRPESSDSRSWGLLPAQNIVGRAFLRLLPIQSLSLFPGEAHESI